MNNEVDRPSTLPAVKRSPVPFVFLLGLLVVSAMVYSLFLGSHIFERYTPLVDAAKEIKFEATIGHLWFEEIISGDRNQNLPDVMVHFDQSEWYANAMLNGGKNSKGNFIPLRSPELRQEIESVLEKIQLFRNIAQIRWEASGNSGIGSEIEQQFDALFNDLLIQSNSVEIALQNAIAQDMRKFWTTQILLIFISLSLTVIAGILFRNYQRSLTSGFIDLQESEEHLSTTLNSIGDAVITTCAEGFVTRMNPVAEKLTGWKNSEAAGLLLDDVLHIINPKTREIAENLVGKVLLEGLIVGLANDTVLISRDGIERQIADSGAPIRDSLGNITGVVLVFRDVSESYEKDNLLRQSEDKFRSLHENASLSYQSLDENGCFLDVNPSWLKTLGYDKEEIIGQSFGDFLHQKWQQHFKRNFSEFKKRGSIQDVQFKIRHKNGNFLDISFEGCIGYFPDGSFRQTYCVFQDITEKKQALIEREQLAKAIEQTNDTVVITDTSGIIQYTNPTFEQLTGHSSKEAIGLNPRILKSEEHDDEFYKKMWDTISNGDTWRGRIHNKKKDGTPFTEDATISPIFDEAGLISHYVAVKRDVTEQLRLEEQYHQAQKVESIGRLAGGVAHDLNNLLTPILGYGEMLMADFSPDDKRRKDVEIILRSGIRARDLVRQLLAFSRKQTLEYNPVKLNDILENFESLLRRTIRENINIQITLSPETGIILADVGQIEQVIMNLAANAGDAMPDGGQLNIETMPVELDETYAASHPGVKPGSYFMIAITDTGHGIHCDTMEKIFEPFFTTKGEQGTGLGLATVYGIVKQHGGNIWVYSEPGKGTTFKVYLPASEKKPTRIQHQTAKETPRKGTETILLAEDNQEVRDLANTILTREGYTVLLACNGKEALALQDSHKGPLNLLLTDVVMPEMDGKKLFSIAVESRPELKVLYMSGYTNNVIAQRGVLDENISFIQKPFTVQALATKVRDVLDKV